MTTMRQFLEALNAKPVGNGWQGHCPAHEDSTASLSVTEKNGKVLVHCHAGCPQAAVLGALRERDLWPIVKNGQKPAATAQKPKRPAPRIPIPEEAKYSLSERLRSEWSVKNRGQAVRGWKYHDAEGSWVFSVVRFEKGERKAILPYYFGVDDRWHEGQAFDRDRPLYGLPDLLKHSALPVLIVEGEKCAEAAKGILGNEVVVTTWPGGAAAVSRADWSQLVGRVATIWPDRDDAGKKAAVAIAQRLPEARIIDVGAGEDGWDVADAISEGWDKERILAFIASATPPTEEVPVERLELQLMAGETPAIGEQILEVLQQVGGLYLYGEGHAALAKIAHGTLEIVGLYWLMGQIERNIRLMKWDGRSDSLIPRDCPERLARWILESSERWPFPRVYGVTRMPLLRLDGSMLNVPGHDEKTRLLYIPVGQTPKIPMEPTHEEVRAAIKTLWKPFDLFPYEKPCDRTIAFSAMLTAPQRSIFDKAPAFIFDAPGRGQGKTLLSQSIAAIGTGSVTAPTPWPDQEEEARKQLFASFLDSPRALIFDNLGAQLKSPSLQVSLTAPALQGRLLGRSEVVDVPTRVLMIFTGNNTVLWGDLVRRFLRARLDAHMEHPETREFAFDPLNMAVAQWQELTMAVLTILRGYFTAGAPRVGTGAFGSFETWDRMIRQALLWIRDNELAPFEIVDVLKVVESSSGAEPETSKLGALLAAWRNVYGSDATTVREALKEAEERKLEPEYECLFEAIEEIAGERRGINAKALGRFIQKYRSRIVNSLRFVPGPMKHGINQWRVVEGEGPEESDLRQPEEDHLGI